MWSASPLTHTVQREIVRTALERHDLLEGKAEHLCCLLFLSFKRLRVLLLLMRFGGLQLLGLPEALFFFFLLLLLLLFQLFTNDAITSANRA